MSNVYQNGDRIRFSATFKDINENFQDPSKVFFQIKTPAGVSTSYEYGVGADIVKISTGRYYIELGLTSSGWWYHRWYSTGNGMAADEGSVYIEPSKFA